MNPNINGLDVEDYMNYLKTGSLKKLQAKNSPSPLRNKPSPEKLAQINAVSHATLNR
jgi:hypothetical protein